jgi:hypothetical protein
MAPLAAVRPVKYATTMSPALTMLTGLPTPAVVWTMSAKLRYSLPVRSGSAITRSSMMAFADASDISWSVDV